MNEMSNEIKHVSLKWMKNTLRRPQYSTSPKINDETAGTIARLISVSPGHPRKHKKIEQVLV